MSKSFITNGFNFLRRLDELPLWRDNLHPGRTKGYSSYIPFLICFLFFGCPCNDESVGPKPPDEYTYTWTVDTLNFDIQGPKPEYVTIRCIWGSSSHDVWAVANSDYILGELWHYDGTRWSVVKNWPYNGIDETGGYLNDLSAVTGFDSINVFFFGSHSYMTTTKNNILKWDGSHWSELPWKNNGRPLGGLGWGVKQNNNLLWGCTSTGQVVKYEGGVLSIDTTISGFRLVSPVIAALENNNVFLNAHKDSMLAGELLGTITKLYQRNTTGNWKLIEDKFIEGAYFDGNGLGLGIVSIGNRLFTSNLGIWERSSDAWIKQLDLYALGGVVLNNEKDIWFSYKHELWHQEGTIWEKIEVPLLDYYAGFALYGQGWTDGVHVFINLHNGTTSYILHGKKTILKNKNTNN